MLGKIFPQVLAMSKTASIVILVVILARMLLKKAPKAVSYALWAVVLFRLLCPLSVKAPVSIVPEMKPAAENYSLADEGISPSGGASKDSPGIRYVPGVWAAGAAGLLLRSAVSYGKLRRKLRIAVPLRDNIYIADDIGSPFVIGFLYPQIYLPCGLGEREQAFIILHEQHHIKRRDHICKALAFLALCIHWFNPLVWVAFVLAGNDMEMSCDEAVVREMGGEIRAEYAASLLKLATGRGTVSGMPLRFGEGNTKARIQNLSRWKHPPVWTVVTAAAAGILLTLCLATDQASAVEDPPQIPVLINELRALDTGHTQTPAYKCPECGGTSTSVGPDTRDRSSESYRVNTLVNACGVPAAHTHSPYDFVEVYECDHCGYTFSIKTGESFHCIRDTYYG